VQIRHRALVTCLGLGLVLSWSACKRPTNSGPDSKGPSSNGAVTEKLDIEKARQLSDGVANDLINRRSAALREKGEGAFRSQVDEAAFARMVDQMYQAYGMPLEFEFKNVEPGNKPSPNGENRKMFKFWYAARTSKAEKGRYFLFVEVVPGDQNVAFSSFAIVQFQGDAPENLR